jgi:hypothetical protein
LNDSIFVKKVLVNSHFYKAFGLTIKSDIQLSGFTDLQPGDVDVTITSGLVPKAIKDPVNKGVLFSSSSHEFLLKVLNVGSYYVCNGNQIIIEPNPKATPEEISLFLFGTAMGALLHQRGMIPLHASAVNYNNAAILFLGHSGVGKSTLASAFLNKGYKIIADDICAVSVENNNAPFLLPGIPHVKLWADSLKKLNLEKENLIKLREGLDKYRKPLGNNEFEDNLMPISHIFLLGTHNLSAFEIKEIKGIDKFQAIKNNTYRFQFIKKTAWEQEFFTNFIPCLNSIRVYRVKRPTKPFIVDDLVQLIITTMQS